MSRGMVAFLAGLGGGYLKAQDKRLENERRAKDDAWRDEQRTRQRDEWQKQDKLESDLRDAAADRTVVSGTVTQSAGGNKVLTTDPEQTAAIQKTLADEAELRGEAAPTSRAGQAVAGNMARGNQITDGPVDVAALNSPDARNQRTVDALQKNGQIERAATMQSTLLDQKAKQLGLTRAQYDFADFETNRRLDEIFKSAPSLGDGVVKILTETQIGGLAGKSFSHRLSADEKMVEIIGQGPDGKEAVVAQFENNERGQAEAMKRFMAAPITTRISWINEKYKDELEARKVAAQEKRADAAETTANATAQRLAAGDGNKPPSGYRWTASGALEAIPGGPGDKAQQTQAKPMPATALKMQNDALDMIGISSSIQADLGAIEEQIKTGALDFGPVKNLVNNARNIAGVSTEQSRNFATFKSTLEKLRNDSLRLNKGVQTDGDAQRAWNELFQNINDPGVVQKRLAEIKSINARAVDLRKREVEDIRNNYGQPQYDFSAQTNVPAAVKSSSGTAAAGASGEVPTIADPAEAMKLPSGSLFKDAGGVTRRRP